MLDCKGKAEESGTADALHSGAVRSGIATQPHMNILGFSKT
jgi:hypothetical protein